MSHTLELITDYILLKHQPFETRFLIVISMYVLSFGLFWLTKHYWRRIYRRIRRLPGGTHVFGHQDDIRHAYRDLLFIAKVFFIVYALVITKETYAQRPYVVTTDPASNSRFLTAAPAIYIEFDQPVDTDNITFYTSPEVQGEWVWEEGLLGLPLKRRVTFYPQESFYPGSEVVVYMVGLRQAWHNGESHEHALAYTAPRVPKITETQPTDQQDDVPVNSSLFITYDTPIGGFVDIQLDISPDPGNIRIENTENVQEIIFTDGLQQDQEYTIDIYQTPRSYQVTTNEDIERGDTEKIHSFRFRTVTAPLIESFSPRGENVLIDQTVRIVFDTDMDRESVEEHLALTPETEGEWSWEDDRTLLFAPAQPLAKDTRYDITLAKGTQNQAGGETQEDLLLGFHTIGAVQVIGINPFSGASGIDPNINAISLTFNQEVDRESAQQHFAMTPQVQGSFVWNDNTLVFQPQGPLAYSTRYHIQLAPGVRSVHGLDSTQQFSYQFTTKSQTFVLGIPWFKQEEDFTCNVAATRMALAYRGVNLSEAAIKSGFGIGNNPDEDWVLGYGIHIDPVADFVSQHRSVSIKRNWNIQELLQEVQNGNAVILWLYNRYSQPPGSFVLNGNYTGYRGMHSEVVRGFIGDPSNPTHILTNDPWRGQLTYTRATFEATWAYLNNTALVVY